MADSFFGSILLYLWILYRESSLYKILNKLYYFLEKLFKNSFFYNLLFAPNKRQMILESQTYKVFYSPFKVLEWLGSKTTFKLITESLILEEIRCYMHSVFSLNTNLIGAFLVSFTALYAFMHRGLNLYIVIGAVAVGIIGILVNRDGMRIIEHSKVMQGILSLFAFDIDFRFYTAQSRKKNLSYGVFLGILTAATAYFTAPITALLLVAGFTAVFVIFYRVEYGLYAVALIAPILGTKYVFALVILTTLSLVVKGLMANKYKWVLDEIGFILIGLLAVYFVATLYSYSRMSSLVLWIVYLMVIGFYIVTINIQKTKDIIFTVVKLFIIAGTLVAIYGIMQYVFGWNVKNGWIDQETFENLKMRAYSTLENPNVLGAYLILTIMLALGLIASKINVIAKLVYLGCVCIMTLCLALTYSRGCWLGFGVAIVVFMTFYNGKLWGLFIPALMVAPLVLPDSIITRFTSIGNMEESSTLVRVKIWMSSLRMVKDFLWTGVGMGTGAYGYVYPFYAYYYVHALHSHNTFIQLLLDGGIMALILFVIFIVVFIKKMTQCYTHCKEKSKDTDLAMIALGITSGVIGFLVQGIFDHLFYNYRLLLIFFMFIAIGVGISRISKNTVGESN